MDELPHPALGSDKVSTRSRGRRREFTPPPPKVLTKLISKSYLQINALNRNYSSINNQHADVSKNKRNVQHSLVWTKIQNGQYLLTSSLKSNLNTLCGSTFSLILDSHTAEYLVVLFHTLSLVEILLHVIRTKLK